MAVTGTDTGVLNFSASNDSFVGVSILSSLRWVGATAAGHKCRVIDQASNVLFTSEADGANFIDGWVFDRKWSNGIYISSMNSGALQIYMSPR
jgi:hypothetical protein